MKIIKMTATFGRLEGAVLELSGGLNILEAPNEAGKSTWCAFLRAMLYGIPTKERDRTGYIAEKNRYQPWSGAPMEGSIDLEWRGKPITLRRFPKGSAPFGGFEAVDTLTGEQVPGLTAENAGEVLLGVSRAVFERSAFVGQSAVPVDGDPELEKRIAALVSSGEEEVSFSETERRLKDWLNRRRHNKSGLIPKLEAELQALDERLDRLDRVGRTLAEARGECADLARRRDALEAESALQRARTNRARQAERQEAVAYLDTQRAEVTALRAESGPRPDKEALRRAQGELAYYHTLVANLKTAQHQRAAAETEAAEASAATDSLFEGLTPAQAAERAAADRALLERGRRSWPVLLALLAAVAAAGVLVWQGLEVWLLLPGAACFVVVLLELLAGRREKKRKAALLTHYGAQTPEDLTARAQAYGATHAAADQARSALRVAEEAEARLIKQRDQVWSALITFVRPFAPTVTDPFGVSAAISKALSLDERLSTATAKLEGAQKLVDSLPAPSGEVMAVPEGAPIPQRTPQETAAMLASVGGELSRAEAAAARLQGERDTLGDPVALEAQRGALTQELSRRRREYDAIALALVTLSEANAELQTRFSPALNRRAGELFSALTGGKYQGVTLTRELDGAALETGAVLPRRDLLLSAGTMDQLYLAVRLAVCELALPAEETAPLVLDDALASFDDARAGLALELLRSLSAQRQMLLFTCHTREKRYLAGRA